MPIYVNKTEITDDEVFKEMQFHPAANREAARDEAAKALLIRELLRQEAVTLGFLAEGADEEALDEGISALIQAEVTAPEATEEICRHYYDQNIERFRADAGAKLPLPFAEVENRIRDYLHTRSIRHGIQSYILDLAGKAKVAGFDLAAAL
ncbi:MAG: hypothetical protein HWE25_00785 [Alphaproteobacteria bacterium]|nr:hypothetical protein [Alphaproteobacteria bacterium]